LVIDLRKVKNMKQGIKLGVIMLGVIMLAGCGSDNATNEQEQLSAILEDSGEIITPSRPAEINGLVSSIDGNKIIVKDEIGKEVLSEEEQAQRKEDRQTMTQEERQALKAQESESVETKDVTLEITVGTSVLKGSGDGSGGIVNAGIEDLKKGTYLSIWMNGDNIETIKIKGL
jgi:hypothetical protein